MALQDWMSNVDFLLRWFHVLFGIIWIGHLYFFNFVNVPFQAALAKEVKPQVNPELLHRALWWFRWGAMMTFLLGWVLFLLVYMHGQQLTDGSGAMTHRAMWILFGGALGSIMWFNVWFIIWPAQKQILGWVKAGQAPAEMAGMAKKALLASRTNTFLSGPMLFGMLAAQHYSSINLVTLIVVIALSLFVMWSFIRMSKKVGAPPA